MGLAQTLFLTLCYTCEGLRRLWLLRLEKSALHTWWKTLYWCQRSVCSNIFPFKLTCIILIDFTMGMNKILFFPCYSLVCFILVFWFQYFYYLLSRTSIPDLLKPTSFLAPPCFLALTMTALSVRCWSDISMYLLIYKILNSAIVCTCASHSINSNRDPDGMQVVLPVTLRERCWFFFSAWKRSMSAQCIPMIYSPIMVCCFTTLPFIR